MHVQYFQKPDAPSHSFFGFKQVSPKLQKINLPGKQPPPLFAHDQNSQQIQTLEKNRKSQKAWSQHSCSNFFASFEIFKANLGPKSGFQKVFVSKHDYCNHFAIFFSQKKTWGGTNNLPDLASMRPPNWCWVDSPCGPRSDRALGPPFRR